MDASYVIYALCPDDPGTVAIRRVLIRISRRRDLGSGFCNLQRGTIAGIILGFCYLEYNGGTKIRSFWRYTVTGFLLFSYL